MNERFESGVLTRIFCVLSTLCDSVGYGEDAPRVAVKNLGERDM